MPLFIPARSYPPRDLPDAAEYVYPGPTPLTEYFRITTPADRRHSRPVEDVLDIDTWDALGDFA